MGRNQEPEVELFSPESESGAGFPNNLQETLTYGEPLKQEFYLIVRIFE